jgi:hypothetical protein
METVALGGEKNVAQDGLSLMRAFLKISDQTIRAEIIDFVEKRVDEIRPKLGNMQWTSS